MLAHFETLISPIITLMAFMFVVGAVLRRWHGSFGEQLGLGCLFGAITVLCMEFPIRAASGVIVDLRGLMVTAAAGLAGPVVGGIAAGMGAAFRLWVGGAGTLSGIAGISLALILGIGWHRIAAPRISSTITKDALLGLSATFALGGFLLLPNGLDIIERLGPILLVLNIVGAIVVGQLFRREVRFYQNARQLHEMAMYDPLTNLLNRRGAEVAAEHAKSSSSYGRGVLYLDLDHFKQINDRFGHDVGDMALALVVERVANSIRDEAIISRQGGDEFAVYFPDLPDFAIKPIAERFRAIVAEKPIHVGQEQLRLSISIGGFHTTSKMPLREMISAADEQLLRSKVDGRDRVSIVYDEDVDEVESRPAMTAYFG